MRGSRRPTGIPGQPWRPQNGPPRCRPPSGEQWRVSCRPPVRCPLTPASVVSGPRSIHRDRRPLSGLSETVGGDGDAEPASSGGALGLNEANLGFGGPEKAISRRLGHLRRWQSRPPRCHTGCFSCKGGKGPSPGASVSHVLWPTEFGPPPLQLAAGGDEGGPVCAGTAVTCGHAQAGRLYPGTAP